MLFLLYSLTGLSQDHTEIALANDYLSRGETVKALTLYKQLAKSDKNILLVYGNYLTLLLERGEYPEAISLVRAAGKRQPENLQVKLDLIYVYDKAGDKLRSEKAFNDLVLELRNSPPKVKIASDYFMMKGNLDYSIAVLSQSRTFLGNPFVYSLELATCYRLAGKKDSMVAEYLNYVTQNAGNLQYVKNVLQALINKEDELEALHSLLLVKVQEQPQSEVYSDILIWLSMQQKDFNGAFIQARSFDKRHGTEGEKTQEVATIAFENGAYKTARKIYEYLAANYKNPQILLTARLGILKIREAQITDTRPVNPDSVNALIGALEDFRLNYPTNAFSFESVRTIAMYHARYLNDQPRAQKLLQGLISEPATPYQIRNQAKLDLGDLYLAIGEPWESTLLYSQVEKAAKESTQGYDAKLRNAKLNYYRGEFKLAQDHLDILKQATTREISNDAIDLSMRIKENLLIDSTGMALQLYALAELYELEDNYPEAQKLVKFILKGEIQPGKYAMLTIDSPRTMITQSILDDVYWLEARMLLKTGETELALEKLGKILSEYPDEILADDAAFQEAEIYEKWKKNSKTAMELYLKFLSRFPGSNYAAEARQRYRQLRGDFKESGSL